MIEWVIPPGLVRGDHSITGHGSIQGEAVGFPVDTSNTAASDRGLAFDADRGRVNLCVLTARDLAEEAAGTGKMGRLNGEDGATVVQWTGAALRRGRRPPKPLIGCGRSSRSSRDQGWSR
jgi:hypothetical protein